jgi:hypothetical protein
MRKVTLFLASIVLLAAASCTKTYKCTIVTDFQGNVSETVAKFEGTKEEMEQYEANGTSSNSIYTQTTTCK